MTEPGKFPLVPNSELEVKEGSKEKFRIRETEGSEAGKQGIADCTAEETRALHIRQQYMQRHFASQSYTFQPFPSGNKIDATLLLICNETAPCIFWCSFPRLCHATLMQWK